MATSGLAPACKPQDAQATLAKLRALNRGDGGTWRAEATARVEIAAGNALEALDARGDELQWMMADCPGAAPELPVAPAAAWRERRRRGEVASMVLRGQAELHRTALYAMETELAEARKDLGRIETAWRAATDREKEAADGDGAEQRSSSGPVG